MAKTLVFSLYVVLAGPPSIPATTVARPSPSSVLCSPGSFIKFLPTTAELAVTSPTCSTNVTIEIGAIKSIEPISNLGNISFGTLKNGFEFIIEKSTSPNATDTRYPASIPNRIGTSLKNPFVNSDTHTIVAIATMATIQFLSRSIPTKVPFAVMF